MTRVCGMPLLTTHRGRAALTLSLFGRLSELRGLRYSCLVRMPPHGNMSEKLRTEYDWVCSKTMFLC
jgi:hypothetical protein